MAKEIEEDEAAQIAAHLEENTQLQDDGCSACGETNFTIDLMLGFMPTISPEEGLDLETGKIYAEVRCENCSNAYLFNLASAGLLEEK